MKSGTCQRCRKRGVLPVFLIFCCSQTICAQSENKAIYLDYTRPMEQRVQDLMSRMTLEEKAIFLNHVGPDIERFKVKLDKWNQNLHAVVWNRPTTMFPVSIAAATWNLKLINEIATAIPDEARAITCY